MTVLSTMEDDAVVAAIPDTLLLQSREVICYLYYESEDVGLTVFEIYIPVMPRLKPASAEYTPEQVDTFDQLVAQLQALIAAVDDMEFSVNAEDGCLYLTQP